MHRRGRAIETVDGVEINDQSSVHARVSAAGYRRWLDVLAGAHRLRHASMHTGTPLVGDFVIVPRHHVDLALMGDFDG